MADKNFKVKSGLQVPSLTTAGPVVTDSSGNVTSSATLPINQGGTGQTTAGNALNALLPLQTGNDNKYLQTNGVTTQWNAVAQQTPTDALAGTKIYTGTTTPATPAIGDTWIDSSAGNLPTLQRWAKTAAGGETSLSGIDDNNITLTYVVGTEQVYLNGILLVRNADYTATNGTSISFVSALVAGDSVNVLSFLGGSVADTYTQAQANSTFYPTATTQIAGKNKIINGDFSIWQRGTSFTNPSVNAFVSDRWRQNKDGSGGTRVYSQQSLTPGSIPGFEGRYFMRYAQTSATSGTTYENILIQPMEEVRTLAGQPATLSFWAKADAARTIGATVLQYFGAGGSGTAVPGYFSVTLSTSWQRYIINFTMPSVSGKTINDADAVSQVLIYLQNLNIAQTIDITGIQLEAGSVATAFTPAGGGSQQAELALCQRYYWRAGGQTVYQYFGWGLGMSSTNVTSIISLPVTMRTTPSTVDFSTISLYNATTNYSVSAVTLDWSGNNQVGISLTSSGITANQMYRLLANNSSSAYLGFSAEL